MGEMIGARFEIGEFIASGGMGVVYRGIDHLTGQIVAIKQLNAESLAFEPTLPDRFKREGETLAALNHPNIVRYIDSVQANGQYYLVMEYVSGGSLAELIEREGRLSPDRALRILLELADALARSHHLQIIHRDIKPTNVLLAEDGTPRLADFGVARLAEGRWQKALTTGGLLVGTLAYQAPEVLNGAPQDIRADIWAFGLLMYQLLVGQFPFNTDSLGSLVSEIVNTPLPDLETHFPNLPPATIDLIYRLLVKDPDQRISSMRRVAAELEAIVSKAAGVAESVVNRPQATPVYGFPLQVTPARERNKLPVQTTPFVGREAELSELARLIADPGICLITILAPGGMGKTRLAIEAAQRVANTTSALRQSDTNQLSFVDGIYFVELAALTSSEQIVSVIASVIGLQFSAEREPRQQLLDFMHPRKLLLILDNFEHLLDGASIVSDIVSNAPSVKILVTSRERVNFTIETVLVLAGMDFPQWDNITDALRYSAAKLFIQSACQTQPGFVLSDDQQPFLARICRLLDGMPLGIVLSAAWVKHLSLQEIVQELEVSTDFLESDMRDIPERQRSIRVVFDYSYQRLTVDEQAVFRKLSIFHGGFMRDAAQVAAGATIKILAALANKLILWREVDGRYQIHELLRQYAEQQLGLAGETAEAERMQSAYYLAFLAQRDADIKGRRQMAALNEIRVDFENIRTAWQWGQDHRQYDAISQVVNCLLNFAEMSLRSSDVLDMLQKTERAFAPVDGAAPHLVWEQVVVRCEWLSFHLLYRADHLTVEAILQRARARGDRREITWCLWVLYDHAFLGTDVALYITLAEEALAIGRVLGDEFYVAHFLNGLESAYVRDGQITRGLACVQESLAIRQRLGDKYGLSYSLEKFGWMLIFSGNLVEAEAYIDQAIAMQEENGKTLLYVNIMCSKAALAFWRGAFDTASQHVQAGLVVARSQNYANWSNKGLTVLSWVASMSGDYFQARELCSQNATIGREFDPLFYCWGLALVHCGLGDASLVERSLYGVLKLAVYNQSPTFKWLCLPLASLCDARGSNPQRAAQRLGLAAAAPQELMAWLDKWPLMIDSISKLRAELGSGEFDVAIEYGKTLDLDTVIAELLAKTVFSGRA